MSARTGWAAGVVAGIAAAVGLFASSSVGASAEEADFGDAARLAPILQGDKAMVAVFQAAMTVAALALVVFAAAVHRHLAAQQPAGSLVPQVASGGLALTAALCLVGAGIGTELFWGLGNLDDADPDAIQSMHHILATMSWVWAGAGLTAAAFAVAALRNGAFARWIGVVSAVAAVLTIGISLAPLQYMSAFVGVLWLLVVSVGLTVKRTS